MKTRCTSSSAPDRSGLALAARLAGLGCRRADGVAPPPCRRCADGVDWRAADATDPEAAADAAKGASVVYQCLNAPYTAAGRNCSRRCSGACWRRPNTPTPCW